MADPVKAPNQAEASNSRPKKAPVGRLRVLAPFISPYKHVIVGALIALIFAAGATLTVPLALRRIIDFGFSGASGGFIDQYFAGLFGIVVILAVATFGRFYLVTWLGERLAADVRMALFNRVVDLSPGFFDTTKTGEITSRLTNDITMIQSALSSTASVALRNILIVIGGTFAMVWTSPFLSGLALIVVPVVVVPIVFLGRRVRRLTRRNQDKIAEMTDYATEILGAVSTVQSFTQEANERKRFGGRVASAFAMAVQRIRTRGTLTAIVILLIFGAVDLVLWVGARQVLGGAMTGGELAQFVGFAILASGSVGSLSEVYGDMQQAAGAAERISELLQIEPDIRAPANAVPMPGGARGLAQLRRRHLPLSLAARCAGAERVLDRRESGRDGGAGGSFRRGQEHGVRVAHPVLRSRKGRHQGRRRGHQDCRSGSGAVAARYRAAGYVHLRRNRDGEHPLRPARRDG